MKTVSAAAAEADFLNLLREVVEGETVVITLDGKPVAQHVVSEHDKADEVWRLTKSEFLEDLKQLEQ